MGVSRRKPTGCRTVDSVLACDPGLTRRTSQCDGEHCQYPPTASKERPQAAPLLQRQPCGNEGSTGARIAARVASVKSLASVE